MNTAGTSVSPGFRDQTLAVKGRKNALKPVLKKIKIKKDISFLYSFQLCQNMSISEVGKKQKTQREEEEEEKEKSQ